MNDGEYNAALLLRPAGDELHGAVAALARIAPGSMLHLRPADCNAAEVERAPILSSNSDLFSTCERLFASTSPIGPSQVSSSPRPALRQIIGSHNSWMAFPRGFRKLYEEILLPSFKKAGIPE